MSNDMFPQGYIDYEQKMMRRKREQHKLESYFAEDSAMIPTDAQERKNIPVYSGFMVYFPLAICEVAKLSQRGNDQHNPGTDLHWDRSKSQDELDSAARHMLGTVAPLDGDEELEHATALAWRSMANLEKLLEKFEAKMHRETHGGCMLGSAERGAKRRLAKEIESSKPQKIAEGHGCGGQPETYRYYTPYPEKSHSGRIIPGEDV